MRTEYYIAIDWLRNAEMNKIIKLQTSETICFSDTLLSGSRATSLINTLLNRAYVTSIINSDYLLSSSYLKSYHMGDDVLIFFDRYDASVMFNILCSRYGLKSQEEKNMNGVGCCEFLRKIYSCNGIHGSCNRRLASYINTNPESDYIFRGYEKFTKDLRGIIEMIDRGYPVKFSRIMVPVILSNKVEYGAWIHKKVTENNYAELEMVIDRIMYLSINSGGLDRINRSGGQYVIIKNGISKSIYNHSLIMRQNDKTNKMQGILGKISKKERNKIKRSIYGRFASYLQRYGIQGMRIKRRKDIVQTVSEILVVDYLKGKYYNESSGTVEISLMRFYYNLMLNGINYDKSGNVYSLVETDGLMYSGLINREIMIYNMINSSPNLLAKKYHIPLEIIELFKPIKKYLDKISRMKYEEYERDIKFMGADIEVKQVSIPSRVPRRSLPSLLTAYGELIRRNDVEYHIYLYEVLRREINNNKYLFYV